MGSRAEPSALGWDAVHPCCVTSQSSCGRCQLSRALRRGSVEAMLPCPIPSIKGPSRATLSLGFLPCKVFSPSISEQRLLQEESHFPA